MALPTRAGVRDAILRAVSGALSRTVLAIFGARSATALPTAGALLAMPVTRSPMRSVGRFDFLFAPSAFAAVRPHGHAVRPSASSVISPQAKHFSNVVMSLPSYPLAAPVEHRSTVSR